MICISAPLVAVHLYCIRIVVAHCSGCVASLLMTSCSASALLLTAFARHLSIHSPASVALFELLLRARRQEHHNSLGLKSWMDCPLFFSFALLTHSFLIDVDFESDGTEGLSR